MTEIDYLEQQERRSREAVEQAGQRLGSVLSTAPVERVVRDHPVLSVGVSASAGIAAGWLLGRARITPRVLGALRPVVGSAVRLAFRGSPLSRVVLGALGLGGPSS